ncbi:MAG: hypothetical protein IK081_14190 [Lachnospiraceae bacterium]|nr:hypothetical protein [Lachnospiraceae bacterium]
MRSIKSFLETFLLAPFLFVREAGKGKPIYKLGYALYFLLWAGSIAMLVFSITNPDIGQCKHNLWLSGLLMLLDFLCFWLLGTLDLEDTDGYIGIIICLALPAAAISVAVIIVNVARMVFGLGGEISVNPVTVPVFMRILAAVFGVLAVLVLLLAVCEIRLIRGSEIVITKGVADKYRSVILKNGKERKVELAPYVFLPKDVFEIRTYLKEEEHSKTVKEGIYQIELSKNEIVVSRGEDKIFVMQNTSNFYLYLNPRGRRMDTWRE